MGRVIVRQRSRMLPFAGVEHALPRDENAIEEDRCRRLSVLAREERRAVLHLLARSSRRARDDRDPLCVDRHRAAHGERFVLPNHVAAGHHQQLMHVWRAGDDRLGARDHDALRVLLDDVHVGVDVRLLVRPLRAIALGVGHRDTKREIVVLHVLEIFGKSRTMLGAAARIVDPRAHLSNCVHRVVDEIALRTTGLLAQDAYRLEFVQQIACGLVEVQHPVHSLPARSLHGGHHRGELRIQREVVGDAERVDAGTELRRIGHRLD